MNLPAPSVPLVRPLRSSPLSRPLLSPSGSLRLGNRAFLRRWEERRQAVRRPLLSLRGGAEG